MSISNESEYVILGCAKSNLSGIAHPFAVVTLQSELNEHFIRVYILRGWQNLREFFPDEVRHGVLFFMDDLSKSRHGQASLLFFRHLSELGVGAIRFICGGKCKTEELDSQIAASLDAGQYPVLWRTSFRPMEEEPQFCALADFHRGDHGRG